MDEDRIGQVISKWQSLPVDMKRRGIKKPYERVSLDKERARRDAKRYRERNVLISRMRSRMYHFIRKSPGKNNHTAHYLGCTQKEYKRYFISRFTEGMTWEKFLAGEIHIDHIVPLSMFGNNEGDLARAFHYTNTQPLWATDNHRKHAKFSGCVQPDLFNPGLLLPNR